jgi:hypothetical protein
MLSYFAFKQIHLRCEAVSDAMGHAQYTTAGYKFQTLKQFSYVGPATGKHQLSRGQTP